MKVKAITPLKDKEDKDLWRIDFEEDSRAMWMSVQPTFSVGYEIDDDKLEHSKSGKSWVFKRKKDTPSKQEPKKNNYGKYSERDSEVESSKRLALMEANRLYLHHIDGKAPINYEEHTKLYNHCAKLLGVDRLVEEIKNMGGVEMGGIPGKERLDLVGFTRGNYEVDLIAGNIHTWHFLNYFCDLGNDRPLAKVRRFT